MAEKEYIERGALLEQLRDYYGCNVECDMKCPVTECAEGRIAMLVPAADVVEAVRCKDCKYFVPKHILLKDGSTRDYTGEERKLPFGVTGDVGINCGSICMLHDYWAENRFPVYVNENDFCSYGERKEETP